uniref:Uncharacterized protein n=1 Tax=Leersia perrieri TaxID=77586 RepID=A0A0D9XD92_9ORYZ
MWQDHLFPLLTLVKPQLKAFTGKIAPSLDGDFLLSLQICGPVKSWRYGVGQSYITRTSFGRCYDVMDKRMQPLVPVNYFIEELQAAQGNSSTATPNFMTTGEFAKIISVSEIEG